MVLHILIVGSGLAGLAAAVTLRRAGHKVHVFEASQLEFEDVIGPVVHLGPKSNELLQQWGLETVVADGVLVKEISEFNQDGTLKAFMEQSQRPGWKYYHRSRLHKALLDSAIALTGQGEPVELTLGTRAVSGYPDTSKIRLEDGREFQGDVVVFADGLNSAACQQVSGNDTVLSVPAKVAVHLSVDVTDSGPNSVIERFRNEPERYEKWFGENIEFLVHSCDPKNLLLDGTVSGLGGKEHHITTTLLQERIRRAFETAHPDFIQLLNGAGNKGLHFWTQQSLPRVEKWTFKRLVLIGDAAHPFLPYELPGTAQTLNDAAALAAQLGPDVGEHEIEELLRTWETLRQNRVRAIQEMERASWYSL